MNSLRSSNINPHRRTQKWINKSRTRRERSGSLIYWFKFARRESIPIIGNIGFRLGFRGSLSCIQCCEPVHCVLCLLSTTGVSLTPSLHSEIKRKNKLIMYTWQKFRFFKKGRLHLWSNLNFNFRYQGFSFSTSTNFSWVNLYTAITHFSNSTTHFPKTSRNLQLFLWPHHEMSRNQFLNDHSWRYFSYRMS